MILDEVTKNVSHETYAKILSFYELLKKWNSSFSLVQEETLSDFWTRHFLDSHQLVNLIDQKTPLKILDIGTGGGFPGIILAIFNCGDVFLSEINAKKIIFLREIIRNLDLENCSVLEGDIYNVRNKFDVITSRAFSSLENLLEIAFNVSCETKTECFFLKGKNYQQEISIAQKKHSFDYEIIPSQTSSEGVIVKIII